jgi:hypothetical protein
MNICSCNQDVCVCDGLIFSWFFTRDQVKLLLLPKEWSDRWKALPSLLMMDGDNDKLERFVVHQTAETEICLYFVSRPVTDVAKLTRRLNPILLRVPISVVIYGDALLVAMDRESGEEISINQQLPYTQYLYNYVFSTKQ